MKTQKDQEHKELIDRVEKNEGTLFDFIEDFSSSDYDSVDEVEAERMRNEFEFQRK